VALAHELGAVLVPADHEHERLVPLDQPAQPRRELCPQRDRQHARDVTRSPSIDGSCVDHGCAAVTEPPEGIEAERGQTGLRDPKDRGPGPVHLAQVVEVGRVAPEPVEERLDESVLVRRGEQRIGAALIADRRPTAVTGRRRAEAPRTVGRVHSQVVGQRQQLLV
jgi:hypothetical protein